jgi:glutamate-1-semialdehyde 2,1-aminomutase
MTVHYPDANSVSAKLYERACAVLPGGNSRLTIAQSPYPLYAKRGQGSRIVDTDDVERIDFFNNATSLQHGHCHPMVVAAVTEQAANLFAVGMATEAEIRLAELIVERVASVDQVRFTNSGTEATFQALRAARAYTGRTKVAKCEGGYHGAYDYVEASLASTPDNWGSGDPATVTYAKGTPNSALGEVVVFPFNDESAIGRVLAPHASSLAAIILDPFPAAMGLPMPKQGYLAALREFATLNGILLIFDEVISFRLGYGGAQEVFGVAADLTAFGKTIGGGMPVGGVGGRRELMAVFDARQGKPALPHAGTFNGNPLTMTAGRASLEMMTREEFDRVNALGEKARQALRETIKVADAPCQVTGSGSLMQFHLHERPITDYRSFYRSAAERGLHEQLHRYLLNHGIFPSQLGLGAISTPMTGADIEQFAETLLAGLRQINWEPVAGKA